MHIITGMLIAGLLGKRKLPTLLPMLRTGPVRTAHAMPGRVRFHVPLLQSDSSQSGVLSEKLPTLQGVESVDVNPTTGSVLVRYQEDEVRPELIFAATVRLLGLDEDLRRSPRPVLVKELRSLFDSLNRVVYDRTGGLLDFSSAVLIVLAAIGVRKLALEGAKAMPHGFTLLWWGLHKLFGHGQE